MKKIFEIDISKIVQDKKIYVVMFITKEYLKYVDSLYKCENCLLFWPKSEILPKEIQKRHAVIQCSDPRKEYCRFFYERHIVNYPIVDNYKVVNGAYIAESAKIGKRCTIFPGAYIGGETVIGDDVYIGSGTKLLGRISIGNNVIIRENSVLGADGLSTNRDENGKALTMPQFGGITIGDRVEIGALTVIGRGAIDDTVIKSGSKIDNSCFISHNVVLGEDTFVVGETIMFGSSSTGRQAYISGNSCIRDGIHIGEKSLVGMGSVVVKPVGDKKIVKGNPAK
ncbi:MAG: hypothetical protein RSA71_05310 [Eubacterium sp.]